MEKKIEMTNLNAFLFYVILLCQCSEYQPCTGWW